MSGSPPVLEHDPDEFTPGWVVKWGRTIKLSLCAVTALLINPPLSWIIIFWICAYRWRAPVNERPEKVVRFAFDRNFWVLVLVLFAGLVVFRPI